MFGMIVGHYRVEANVNRQRCKWCNRLFIPGDFVGWDAKMNVYCNRTPGGKPFCQRNMEGQFVNEEIEKAFFMVAMDNHSMHTSMRHRDLTSASGEADRLAKANPGRKYYVLKAIATHSVEQLPVVRKELTV